MQSVLLAFDKAALLLIAWENLLQVPEEHYLACNRKQDEQNPLTRQLRSLPLNFLWPDIPILRMAAP